MGRCGRVRLQPRKRDVVQRHLQLLRQDGTLPWRDVRGAGHTRGHAGRDQREQPEAHRRHEGEEARVRPQEVLVLRDVRDIRAQRGARLPGRYVVVGNVGFVVVVVVVVAVSFVVVAVAVAVGFVVVAIVVLVVVVVFVVVVIAVFVVVVVVVVM